MNKETAIRIADSILLELEKANLDSDKKIKLFISIAKIIDEECVEPVFFEREN